MNINQEVVDVITEQLLAKASSKQFVYRNTKEKFEQFKIYLSELALKIEEKVKACDNCVNVKYSENNDFEAQIQFSGDVLVFNMHTNVFTFEESHLIHTTEYVKKDPFNAYCGMIEVYNFLSDSLKYQRMNDTGYLICRIFINKDSSYIIEGERPMVELNEGLGNCFVDEDFIQILIEQCIGFAIGFDLWAPPYQAVKEVTVSQKLINSGLTLHQTSKRMGFKMQRDLKLDT